MKKYVGLVGLALFFGILVSAHAADDFKIGIVDLQRLFEESSAGKQMRAEINRKGKQMEADLKQKSEEVDKMKKDLEREALVISREQKDKKERDIDIKIYDIKLLKRKYNEELLQFQQEKIELLKKDLFEVVQEVGKKGGYMLIMEKIGVLYSPTTIDITDEVVNGFNMKYGK